MKSACKNELAKKLSICGQVAEHKSEKVREHGGDDESIFSVLSEEEKAELMRLLTRLESKWIEDHKAHHINVKK